MYEFWYGYVKPKYFGKSKRCYMDTDNFIVHVKTGLTLDLKQYFTPRIMN